MPESQSLTPPESAYIAVSSAGVKIHGGEKKKEKEKKDSGWGEQDSRGWGKQYFTGWGFSPGRSLLFSRKMAAKVSGDVLALGSQQLLYHISPKCLPLQTLLRQLQSAPPFLC